MHESDMVFKIWTGKGGNDEIYLYSYNPPPQKTC